MTLVCPRCRRAEGGELLLGALRDDGDILLCPACGATYPVVDDTPMVLSDVDTWLADQLPAVIARPDLAKHRRLWRGAPRGLREQMAAASVYRARGDSPLAAWARAQVEGLSGEILDVGCGRGMHERADVTGLELSWAMLQGFPGRRVIGDAADPPFGPETFDAVLLFNLVDSTADPELCLWQADAMLKPGGTLILTTPFAWRDDITPPARQFTADALLGKIEGGPGQSLGYTIEAQEDALPWVLRAGRATYTYECLAVRARKPLDARRPLPVRFTV